MDDSGNYNVQVLSEALKVYNAELISINTKKLITMLKDDVDGILFNSSTHWFTIRKIDGIWFNLNSTNSTPGPEIISDFYLSAFIQGTVDIGYTNFMIKNLPRLPDVSDEIYRNLIGKEKGLVSIEEVVKAKEAKNGKKQNNNNINNVKKDDATEKEKEDDKKFKAFQGQGVSLSDYNNMVVDEELDEETRKAIEMSLNDYIGQVFKNIKKEPDENDPECYTIIFKIEDKTFTRRFNPHDTIGVIFFFICFKNFLFYF